MGRSPFWASLTYSGLAAVPPRPLASHSDAKKRETAEMNLCRIKQSINQSINQSISLSLYLYLPLSLSLIYIYIDLYMVLFHTNNEMITEMPASAFNVTNTHPSTSTLKFHGLTHRITSRRFTPQTSAAMVHSMENLYDFHG